MGTASQAIKQAMLSQPQEADGRRARSAASRRKIIAAMSDLIAAGDPNPSAALVAETAGVGLRSVFRHFDDKDSIFREIDQIVVSAFQPMLAAPFQSDDSTGKLFELIERRADLYEAIAPFRLAAHSARKKSPFLRENYMRHYEAEKRMLDDVLPEAIQTHTRIGRNILIATSFDAWRLLRQDEQLSQDDTVAAIKEVVSDILAGAGNPE